MHSASETPAVDHAVLAMLEEAIGAAALDTVVRVMLEQSTPLADALRTHAADGSLRGMRDSAHQLKGATANLGAVRLPALCQRIEASCAMGDVDGARALIVVALAECAEVAASLTTFMSARSRA